MKVSAIITAAGAGKRMGTETPKQFLKLWDRPILLHTLDNFEASQYCDFIAVVTNAAWVDGTKELMSEMDLSKEWLVVTGGAERQDSVKNGLEAIPEETDIVIVHDGVRPFVDAPLIDRSVECANEMGGCIVAVPVKDTIKKAGENDIIKETVDRSLLWAAQTPQTFKYNVLKRAFVDAYSANFYGTDEASLVERIGHPVKLLMGSDRNIKITTPEDLEIASALAGS